MSVALDEVLTMIRLTRLSLCFTLLFASSMLVLTQTAAFASKQSSSTQLREAVKPIEYQKTEKEKESLHHPVQIVINSNAVRVRNLIIARAAAKGSTLEEVSDYKIVLSRPVGGLRGIMTQALIGNAYSDEPKSLVTLVVVELENGKVLVTADAAVVVRMPLGNVNRVDLNKKKKVRAELNKLLEDLKAEAEASP